MFNSPIIRRAGWFTWLILGLCLILTLSTFAGENAFTQYWLYEPNLIAKGQVWRLLTPIFLHFTLLGSPVIHLLFNGMWWLVVASIIEQIDKKPILIILTLITAIGSNTAAYIAYGPWFGGLSGVCYGIIAYSWLRGFLCPLYRQTVNHSLFFAFFILMIIGFTGIFGAMANIAHLAGLLLGLFYALVINLFERPKSAERHL